MKSGCNGKEAVVSRSIPLPVLKTTPAEKSTIRESRTSKWRAAALISLTLLMIAHIIQ
jgi:hypothetical protein